MAGTSSTVAPGVSHETFLTGRILQEPAQAVSMVKIFLDTADINEIREAASWAR